MQTMMRAYAEGEERAKINQALGSLGIQLKSEDDSAQYSIKTTAAIVRAIMEKYGTDLKKINDDDMFTAGIFLFAISNHITRVVGAPFEQVAAITPLELLRESRSLEQLAGYVNPIGNTYNNAAKNSKIIDAIGQNIVEWISTPEHDRFDKIVKLYGLCRENIK